MTKSLQKTLLIALILSIMVWNRCTHCTDTLELHELILRVTELSGKIDDQKALSAEEARDRALLCLAWATAKRIPGTSEMEKLLSGTSETKLQMRGEGYALGISDIPMKAQAFALLAESFRMIDWKQELYLAKRT